MASGGGTALLDFGPATAPSTDAVCVVSGQTGLTLTGQVEAWIRADDTNDHSVDELRAAGPRVLAKVTAVGEVTIYATAASGADYGAYVVDFVWYDRGAGLTWPAVTAYYSSPGGAGDYAEADSVVAARVVFPGASAPVCTVLAWAKGFNGGDCMRADNALQFAALRPGLVDFIVGVRSSDEAVEIEPSVDFDPGAAEWSSVAAVFDGSAVTPYGDGVAGTPGPIVGGGWVAADVFQALVASAAGDIRNILIIDRALSANEIADLYVAGPTHHPLNAAGSHWAAGQSIPVIWCTPAVNGSVANSGDGGPCRLSLRGSITSEEDA